MDLNAGSTSPPAASQSQWKAFHNGGNYDVKLWLMDDNPYAICIRSRSVYRHHHFIMPPSLGCRIERCTRPCVCLMSHSCSRFTWNQTAV